MLEKTTNRIRQVCAMFALIITIVALQFGISRYLVKGEKAIELNFYEYRIAEREIVISPETYTGGEVSVEITTNKAGLSVQYKLANSDEWIDYTGPFSVDENMQIDTRLVSEADSFEGPVTEKEIKNIAVAKIGDVYYKTLSEAIEACPGNAGNTKTTIEMLTSVEESVVIPEGKNIILDLCGATISGTKQNTGDGSGDGTGTTTQLDATITVNGQLNLIDSAQNEDGTLQGSGKVTSTTQTAIKVAQTGKLVLGTNESATGTAEEVVDITKPVIQGNTYGVEVEQNGQIEFYDGKISGKTEAIKTIDDTDSTVVIPNDFMILTTNDGEYEVTILSKTAIITFDKNPGSTGDSGDIDTDSTITLEYETATRPTGAKIESLPTAQREGYAFIGWYTAKENGEQVTLETIVTDSTTYYAIWEAYTYTIEYNANGGTGTTVNTNAKYDEEITLPDNTFTAPDGYTFKQWNTNADGTGTSYNPGDNTKNLTNQQSATVQLYAIWEDTIAPTTTAPTGTGTTNSITINSNQSDNGTGIDETTIEYAIFNQDTNSDGTPDAWSEWQTSNTFTNLKSNTEYQVKTRVKDKNGNGPTESEIGKISTTQIENGSVEVRKDSAQGEIITPETSSENTDNQINNGLYISIIPSSTGTTTVTVKGPNGETNTYTQSATITTETGMYEIIVETTDGTNTVTDSYYIYVDKTEPTANPTSTSTTNSITVNANAQDANSGVEDVTYTIKKGNEIVATNKTGEFTNLEDNTDYTVEITVTDKAGNTTTTITETIKTEELTAGTIKFTESTTGNEFTPANTTTEEKVWINENINTQLTQGNAGTTTYEVTAPDGTKTTYTADTQITTQEGTYKVVVTTTDGTNTETREYYFNVEKTIPTVTINPNEKDYTLAIGETTLNIATTVTVEDGTNGSGIAISKYAWSTSNTVKPEDAEFTDFSSGTEITKQVEGGKYYLWIMAEDNAGNKVSTENEAAIVSGEFNIGYTIEYNLNGGTGDFASIRKPHGQNVGLSTEKPTRELYIFKGWTETENSSEVNYAVGATYIKDQSATLYAVWGEVVASTTIGEETITYESVQEAITAAGTNSGAIVTLIKSEIQDSVTVAAGQDITLNLNGKTLNGNDETAITNYGTLTITGESGTVTGTGADKSTILNNGTCEISAGTVSSENYNAIYNQLGGKLTISGGNIEAKKHGVHNNGDDLIENVSEVTVTGGTITSTGSNAIKNESTGNMYIKGGTVEVNTSSTTIYNYGSGLVEVDGGTVKNTGTGKAILGQLTGTIEVKSGSVSSVSGDTIYNENTGTVKVSGGSVSSSSGNTLYNNATGEIIVTGGTITGTNGIYNNGAGNITVGVDESTPVVSTTSPSINATNYGVYVNTGTFNFYDGKIVGAENKAISGNVADVAEGYFVDKSVAGGVETAILLEKNYESIAPDPCLADVVEVGDYVNYDASSNGVQTFTSSDCLAGSSISATISTADDFNSDAVSQWKVLSVDRENGIVELMSTDPTLQTIKLTNGIAFANAEKVLNNVGAIYGQGKGATVGRSITIEDVQQYSSYVPSINNTKTYTTGNFYKEIKDENGNVTGYETILTAASRSNPITMTNTYYTYTDSSYFLNSTIYNMFFLNSTDTSINKSAYFLASRCVENRSYCEFDVRYVGGKKVGAIKVYTSANSKYSGAYSVVPVVTLESNIQTIGQDSNGVWQLKLEEAPPTYYETLSAALQNSPTGSTIKALNGIQETTAPTLAADKEMTLDLNGKITTLNFVTLTNNGTLTITDTQGNGKLSAISANTITNNGTLTLGTNEETPSVSTTTPNITSTNTAVLTTTGTFNFYDGIIKGTTGASINGTVANMPQGYRVVKGTETIDSVEYETSYLDNTYNVTFDENCENGTTTTKSIKYNTPIGTLPTPTTIPEGYAFAGWYTAQTDGTEITEESVVTSDITVYAIWELASYSEYDSSGNYVASYTTMQSAVDGAASGNTIKALKAVNESTDVVVAAGKTLTLDLNEQVVTFDSARITNNGYLTIVGGELISTSDEYSAITVSSGARLILGVNDGNVSADAPSVVGSKCGIEVADGGTFRFYDGIVKGKSGEGSAISGTVSAVAGGGYELYKTVETVDGVVVESARLATVAVFDEGMNVNAKMKKLSGSTNATYRTYNSNIYSIQEADDAPDVSTMETNNIVSASTSNIAIYMWYEENNIYWWSEAEIVKLNRSSTYMFYYFSGLTDLEGLANWETSSVISMSYMFFGSKLTDLTGLSNWTTSSVTDMSSMFSGCSKLIDITGLSNWTTSSVTNMSSMFNGCRGLTELTGLSNWTTSSVTNMSSMFNGCSGLTELTGLSNWTTSSVTNMSSMFNGCSGLTELTGLSNWTTSSVTNMGAMFYGCSGLTELTGLSNWITSSVTSMSGMFYRCRGLTDLTELSSWTTSSVTSMSDMFRECSGLIDLTGLSNWTTSSVTSMSGMFYGCSGLTDLTELSSWTTSSVTNMSYMFYGCSGLTDLTGLSNWTTSRVTNMSYMYYGCKGLTDLTELSSWTTSSVTNMSYMFYGCSGLTDLTGLSNWTTSRVTNMSYMFVGCSGLKNLTELSSWTTSSVTNMSWMYYGCSGLTDLTGLSNWTTSRVIDMSYMFRECSGLTDLTGLSNWTTNSVTNMNSMFYGCRGLTDLTGISNWTTSSVTNMSTMFYECECIIDLTGISNWTTSNVTNMRFYVYEM